MNNQPLFGFGIAHINNQNIICFEKKIDKLK